MKRSAATATWAGTDGVGALSGVRVLDFGQYIAGPVAAGLMADQGADVIHIDPPGGPRWDHPANAALLRGRRSMVLDLKDPDGTAAALGLVGTADVLIENFRPGVMRRLRLGPDVCLSRNPQLVYCSLPGFGEDDPRAALAAWEGVVLAAGGAYATDTPLADLGHLRSDVGATFSALPLSSIFAALEGALGIVSALIAQDRDGVGQQLEVPLFDALFEASGVRAMSFERNFPAMTQFGAGFYRCADGGYISLSTMWLRHLEWLVEAAGVSGWSEAGLLDFHRLWSDAATGAELARRLVELFTTKTAPEWEKLGREAGVPLAMLRSTTEWMQTPQALESRTLIDVVDPMLGPVRVPGPAVEIAGPSPRPRPRRPVGADTTVIMASLTDLGGRPDPGASGAGTQQPQVSPPVTGAAPLDGIRVLDLTRVLAGPTAARLLGQLGADVIKVDADPARSRSCIPEPMVHEHANRGKRGIALDLKSDQDRARLRSLTAETDVVIENFSIGVSERLGIDLDRLRETSPSVVLVYLNTYGVDGPWAKDRGYAELANVVTGLTERTLPLDRPSGPPNTLDVPPWPFTDYGAGVLAAFGAVAALYRRGSTSRGQLVETSLVRAATLEQVIYAVASASPKPGAGISHGPGVDSYEPRGAASVGWSPWQRLFQAADGWLFVGTTSDRWPEVANAFDAVAGGTDDDELEVVVAKAVAAVSVAEAVNRLQGAGIGAHEVVPVAALMGPDGPAGQRGLRLEEDSDRFGRVVMAGPVIRLDRTPLRPGRLPAAFGSEQGTVWVS